jgi:D-sedoheptulose 7-phosphate isomerase
MDNKIQLQIDEHIEIAKLLVQPGFVSNIALACQLAIDCIERGNKVLLFGNGGSASDAQHIAAEFTGRFVKERKGLPAIALTTDTSAITAISNDYGFKKVFDRQVEALARPGDLLIGISTSGNSENVILGLLAGKRLDCQLLGLTGNDGGQVKDICDVTIIIDSKVTARIQEMHILIGHIICSAIDDRFSHS